MDRERTSRRSRRHEKRHKRSRSRERDREESKRASKSSTRHKKHHRDEEGEELRRNQKLLKRAKEFVVEQEEKNRDSSKKSKKNRSRNESSKKRRSDGDDRGGKMPKLELGPARDAPPEIMLDEETDYFRYHNHLRIYLATKGLAFEELNTQRTHEYFIKFCKLYNRGELPQSFYLSDLPDDTLQDAKRTNHKWGFKTTETERKTLDYVKSGVKKQTEYNNSGGVEASVTKGQHSVTLQAVKGDDGNASDDDGKRVLQKVGRKQEHRRLKERIKLSNEEMGYAEGKTHGHERKLEKRREQSTKQHGSAAQKEESAFGGVIISDGDIYGRTDDYKRALDREKKMKERLKSKKALRLQELESKERDKQSNMLKSLGLSNIKPGQKISIAPRNDP